MRILTLFLFFFGLFSTVSSQTALTSDPPDVLFHSNISEYRLFKNSSIDSTKEDKVIFDIHLAAGLQSGLRIGGRFYITKNISTELSYGVTLGTFGGDGEYILGFGLNLFPIKNHSFMVSLLGFQTNTTIKNTEYIFSPSVVFLTPRKKGAQFLARAGLNFKNAFNDNPLKIRPNFEIGLAIGF